LPTGLQVVQGQASVATQGALMTVKNSPGAILNWQSFSIGSAAGVHFQQVNATSKVLNRVVGRDPSALLGSLTSNGQVWLLNPNGVLFGQGARVDVAGLVASTLRLPDSDFLAGRYRFSAAAGDAGTVRNEGALQTTFGGQVVLLGSRVENTGSVVAPGGSVALAAGRSVELVDTGLPHLAVKVELPASADGAGGSEVLNLGRLVSDGGKVDIYAGIVNQQGLVQADTLGTDAQGRVTLQAAQQLNLAEGSITRAAGGTLRLDAGAEGQATVAGLVDASSAQGRGGDLLLQGRRILLGSTALLDASGATGGGLLRVGGDFQGKNPLVRHADMVTALRGATLRADATGQGDGGLVVVWSDSATRFGGHVSTRGGLLGGHGGLAEV
jgi:filamentous hemagglutinin family protein